MCVCFFLLLFFLRCTKFFTSFACFFLSLSSRLLDDEQLDWDSLQKMDLLHRCVKEALRMGPPLIFIMRKTLRDFTFKDKLRRVCVCVRVFFSRCCISLIAFLSLTAAFRRTKTTLEEYAA